MSQPMEDQISQKVFGGCEGPDAMYVKLISSDGHEFIGNVPCTLYEHSMCCLFVVYVYVMHVSPVCSVHPIHTVRNHF